MLRHGIEDFEPFECPCIFCKNILFVTEARDLNLTDYSSSFDDNFHDVMIYVICPECRSAVICPDDQQRLYLTRLLVRRKSNQEKWRDI